MQEPDVMKGFLQKLKGDGVVRVEADKLDTILWQELWRFRELFFSMAWRDFLVRYKQTAVGILWAVLDPLISMLVLVLIFGVIAKMPESTPVGVFAGLLPWQIFSLSLTNASMCLVNNAPILTKIYFPRLILPTSAVTVNFIDLLINCGILLVLMLLYGTPITWRFLLVVPIVIMGVMIAFGLSLFVSSLYVKFRDFKMMLPFFLKIGMLLTPVGYQLSGKDTTIQVALSLNPLTGVVEACRWAVLDGYSFFAPSLFVTFAVILFLLFFGFRFFRRSEQWFSDII